MDDSSAVPATAGAMLDAGAHAMRNDVATLRMATRLVDDTEIASAMAEALDDLQVRLERAVVAARIELGRRPDVVTLDAAELLRLGAARAAREGRRDEDLVVRVEPASVTTPGPWAERLVADVLHRAGGDWLDALAAACGAAISHEGGGVTLTFGSGA